MTGTPRLVWGWADDGSPPFAPYIEAHDAATGAPACLTLSGKLNQLHLVGAQG